MSDSKTKSTNKISTWFKGLKAEFKRIIWPDKVSVARQTFTVTIITVILGIIIAMVDAVVKTGLNFIIGF